MSLLCACPNVYLHLLGPYEDGASWIPPIPLPGDAHLAFLHTIERLDCVLQLL